MIPMLLGNFHDGVAHILALYDLKTAFSDFIPHRLASLAHHSEDEAARAARDCIEQYDSAPDTDHHALSLICCSPASAVRKEMEMVGRRECSVRDTRLLVCCLRFKLLSIVSRIVEAKHGLVHRINLAKRNVTGPYISCGLREWVIEKLFEEDGDGQATERFLELLTTNGSPKAYVEDLGFGAHPLLLGTPKGVRFREALAGLIIYHCDTASQYADCGATFKAILDRRKEAAAAVRNEGSSSRWSGGGGSMGLG